MGAAGSIPITQTSLAQQRAMAYAPKLTSALSILGSLYIIYDVLRLPKRHTYHRILLGMNIVDLLSLLGWVCSTWPMPVGTPHVVGALGNQATCDTQGFLSQWSLATILYNGCLTAYFLLVIRFGWTERRIAESRVEQVFHVACIGMGLATSVAALALGLYNPDGWVCWITAVPLGCKETFTLHQVLDPSISTPLEFASMAPSMVPTAMFVDNNLVYPTLILTRAPQFTPSPTAMILDANTTATPMAASYPCERGDNASLYLWFFFYIPVWGCIIFATIALFMVYRAFQRQEQLVQQFKRPSRMFGGNKYHSNYPSAAATVDRSSKVDGISNIHISSSLAASATSSDANEAAALPALPPALPSPTPNNSLRLVSADLVASLNSATSSSVPSPSLLANTVLDGSESPCNNTNSSAPPPPTPNNSVRMVVNPNSSTRQVNPDSASFSTSSATSVLLGMNLNIGSALHQRLQQRRQNRQGRQAKRKKNQKAQLVTSQALLYVASFYVAWIFPSLLRARWLTYYQDTGIVEFAWKFLAALFAPLQGLLNFVIYLRPKYLQIQRTKRKMAALEQRRRKNADMTTTAVTTTTQHDEDEGARQPIMATSTINPLVLSSDAHGGDNENTTLDNQPFLPTLGHQDPRNNIPADDSNQFTNESHPSDRVSFTMENLVMDDVESDDERARSEKNPDAGGSRRPSTLDELEFNYEADTNQDHSGTSELFNMFMESDQDLRTSAGRSNSDNNLLLQSSDEPILPNATKHLAIFNRSVTTDATGRPVKRKPRVLHDIGRRFRSVAAGAPAISDSKHRTQDAAIGGSNDDSLNISDVIGDNSPPVQGAVLPVDGSLSASKAEGWNNESPPRSPCKTSPSTSPRKSPQSKPESSPTPASASKSRSRYAESFRKASFSDEQSPKYLFAESPASVHGNSINAVAPSPSQGEEGEAKVSRQRNESDQENRNSVLRRGKFSTSVTENHLANPVWSSQRRGSRAERVSRKGVKSSRTLGVKGILRSISTPTTSFGRKECEDRGDKESTHRRAAMVRPNHDDAGPTGDTSDNDMTPPPLTTLDRATSTPTSRRSFLASFSIRMHTSADEHGDRRKMLADTKVNWLSKQTLGIAKAGRDGMKTLTVFANDVKTAMLLDAEGDYDMGISEPLFEGDEDEDQDEDDVDFARFLREQMEDIAEEEDEEEKEEEHGPDDQRPCNGTNRNYVPE